MNKHKTDNLIHDIINKLSIVKGQIDRRAKGKEVNLDKIDFATEKIINIVKNYRSEEDLQCMPNSEAEIFANAWMQSMEILYGIRISKDIQLRAEDELYIDVNKMDSIFTNALENAINAGATKFLLKSRRAALYTEFTLVDNSCGMTQEEIDSLGFGFTKGGHGKGTQYMREMAVSMNGTAVWKSKVNIGTMFSVKVSNGPLALNLKKAA